MPLSLNASILLSSLNACFDVAIHCMISDSLDVEISFETLIWNKKSQLGLYLGMGLYSLVILNLNA